MNSFVKIEHKKVFSKIIEFTSKSSYGFSTNVLK